MKQLVNQEILDALTRVKMPGAVPMRQEDDTVVVGGQKLKVYRTASLVLGSGAAGMRAAVELKRSGVDVTVVSSSLYGGTSACSGSDKQTLHTAGTSNSGDNFNKLAADLGSGGCMDADTAYIEATGSLRAFSSLQYLGLPLPEDRFGAVLRYQTDHDDVGRATSCGPRTSRLMVKVLAEEAIRLEVDFIKGATGVEILKEKGAVCGMIITERGNDTNECGVAVVLCEKLVIATGGPGELYRDSVYPKNCFGSLGMALEAGVKLTNLTESQFGIGTRRTEFPWNLSGTYVQVIPYIYSVDDAGVEHNFLGDYYRTTQELASNVFRKGYQWPFHATRMLNFNSSLVDVAIFNESRQNRTVFMDFNRNPKAVPGDRPFSLKELDADVRAYLENNEALQEMPIERLRRMNPLAIELYKMHNCDIANEPLPFAVNNQHMNGGIDVDIWSQSSLEGCYAVGEVAGTHGVTRPGGSALNAGQVFGTRAAQHIANSSPQIPSSTEFLNVEARIFAVLTEIQQGLSNVDGLEIENVKSEIQARMSDKAGFICKKDEIAGARVEAKTLNLAIAERGLKLTSRARIDAWFQWRHMALTSEAVLSALLHYAENGGGSRGARAICSASGTAIPETNTGSLEDCRFIEERQEDKEQKLIVKYESGDFYVSICKLRQMEDPGTVFFEKNWPHYLMNTIFDDDFKH